MATPKPAPKTRDDTRRTAERAGTVPRSLRVLPVPTIHSISRPSTSYNPPSRRQPDSHAHSNADPDALHTPTLSRRRSADKGNLNRIPPPLPLSNKPFRTASPPPLSRSESTSDLSLPRPVTGTPPRLPLPSGLSGRDDDEVDEGQSTPVRNTSGSRAKEANDEKGEEDGGTPTRFQRDNGDKNAASVKRRTLLPPPPSSVLGKRKASHLPLPLPSLKKQNPPDISLPSLPPSPLLPLPFPTSASTSTLKARTKTTKEPASVLVPPSLAFKVRVKKEGEETKVKKALNHPLIGETEDGDEGRGGDVERWDSPRKRRRGDVVKNGLREMAQQIITQANSRHALWHSSLSRSLSSHSPHLPLSLSALDPAPSFDIQIKRLLHSPKTSKLLLFACSPLSPSPSHTGFLSLSVRSTGPANVTATADALNSSPATEGEGEGAGAGGRAGEKEMILACSLPTQLKGALLTLSPPDPTNETSNPNAKANRKDKDKRSRSGMLVPRSVEAVGGPGLGDGWRDKEVVVWEPVIWDCARERAVVERWAVVVSGG
ncbi:hypothetical protein BT69DRAFT_1334170 [Atractiella rhizophila]|nr:hypothetical protein BT69DRAFT_1334170 [Atractiella rhizophila]